MLRSTDNSSKTQLTDSIKKILDIYFDGKVTSFFSNTLEGYKLQSKLPQAMKLLYITTNYSSPDFESFVGEKLSDPSCKELVEKLRTVSQLCNGSIKADDRFFAEHRELIAREALSDQDLKTEIGHYFKDRSNTYLSTEYTAIYKEIDRGFKQERSQSPLR